jgi:molybdopterin converting factor small subunit
MDRRDAKSAEKKRRKSKRMKVEVVFYGGLKQEVGAKRQTVEVARDGLTVAELVDVITQQHPALEPRLSTVAYVVGNEVVEPDYVLHDGDEAGLLPPVSGG